MSDSQKLPAGFQYSGVACGIKTSGKPDLALIVGDQPVTAAGVYTQNQIVAAPVLICRAKTPSDSIRAVVANSGNANACTGEQGMADAGEMCRLVAEQLDCRPEQVLVMSTGIIGQTLPMDCIREGIEGAAGELASGAAAFNASAEAIRTTDKDRKTAFRQITCGSKQYSIAAMAKGAGMIAPNMATLLAVVLTDAPLSTESAHQLIDETAKRSFNRVSVDGHTSTNDTLLLLASGRGESLEGEELASLGAAITDASIGLAKMLVADGEGASHLMALRVHGAEDDEAAELIATAVAASPLVKTAITGGDPNWGRIVSAAGYAGPRIDPAKTSLKLFDTTIYRNGTPAEFDEAALRRKMNDTLEVPIDLQVGEGPGSAEYWSSDLTTDYVVFNSEYTT